jgi:general secretion pathway protein C
MINRYITIANLLLITAGVYLCVSSFYTIVMPRLDYGTSSSTTQSRVSPSPLKRPSAPLDSYKSITKRNIFNSSTGEVTTVAEKTKIDLEKLKQTELKLKLWGTVIGQNGQTYAVIEDTKAREQNLYRSGDTIQKAVVKLILREKVVLSVNDRDEILAMEEISGRRIRRRSSSGRVSSASGSPSTKLPVSRYPRKIKLKSSQVEKALENLGQLMEQATLRPHIEDGQPTGISITGIKPNAIFRKMRLRNGDIITGVNGNSIGSVEDAAKFIEQLSSGSNVQLQIKRRGREQTLDYSIE